MAKTTYNNLVTVPDAATDTISDGVTVGGDIVANFKKIANVIYSDGVGGVQVAGAPCHSMAERHIVNNNCPVLMNLPFSEQSLSDYSTYGIGSGAIVKGMLTRLPYGSDFLVLEVPYAGAMILHYDIIIYHGSNYNKFYTYTGTLTLLPEALVGDTSVQNVGLWLVENGSLRFAGTSSLLENCPIQFGLHGTAMLPNAGSGLGSGQTSSESAPYYSSSSSDYSS
ncbi:MAG: hypothetical protein Q4D38_14465 [Planctomycetia bacterium]|nr:hypothetical protein [Planctomycetia bacterium]